MNLVFLSLGSNKSFVFDDREYQPFDLLRRACESLKKVLLDVKISTVYITKPMYYDKQEHFYNMALCGYFEGSPDGLLVETQSIESMLGRNREEEIRNGPRTIDIDILLFSNFSIKTNELIIPHKKMDERAFVIIPMLEILPIDADSSIRDHYEQCLQKLKASDVVKYKSFSLEAHNEP